MWEGIGVMFIWFFFDDVLGCCEMLFFVEFGCWRVFILVLRIDLYGIIGYFNLFRVE